MKVVIAYEVPASTYAEVQKLIDASVLRDIDLNGVNVELERGDFTSVEVQPEEDSIDASSVLQAVYGVIDGTRDETGNHGLTIFNCHYDRA